jgi:hypothetical protein
MALAFPEEVLPSEEGGEEEESSSTNDCLSGAVVQEGPEIVVDIRLKVAANDRDEGMSM